MANLTHIQMYQATAAIINKITDKAFKQVVADHFATQYRKTYKGFDAAMWERATGGKVQGYNIHTGKFDDEPQTSS